jgi:nucleotide-binding universal stress UspA family protein
LCPIDFSTSSLAAFQLAASMAEEADAHLTLLHAIDWSANEGLLVEDYAPPDLRLRVETAARERLESLVTDEMRVWCQPDVKMAHAKPYQAILDEAQRGGADLIVMGVHGRNAVDLAIFGSNANHVIRSAPCPVLTVRT